MPRAFKAGQPDLAERPRSSGLTANVGLRLCPARKKGGSAAAKLSNIHAAIFAASLAPIWVNNRSALISSCRVSFSSAAAFGRFICFAHAINAP
jgi:hypothetical protein